MLWPKICLHNNVDPRQMALLIWADKTSSQGGDTGKWDVYQGQRNGVIRLTDRGGEFPSQTGKRRYTGQEFPLYHAWWLSLCYPAGTSGRTEGVDLAVSRLTSSNRESHARIQARRAPWKASPFLGAKMRQGLHLQLPTLQQKTTVFLSAYSFLRSFL